MKRKDLVPGHRYVTETGDVFEIVSNDAGYEVKNGEHVHEPKYKQRYMGAEKGYKNYQTNTKIAALAIKSRRKEPVAIEPRDLVMTIADWEIAQGELDVEREKLAVEKRGWEKAFKDATGLTGHVHFETDSIVVSLTALKRKGIKPGVK